MFWFFLTNLRQTKHFLTFLLVIRDEKLKQKIIKIRRKQIKLQKKCFLVFLGREWHIRLLYHFAYLKLKRNKQINNKLLNNLLINLFNER